MIAPMMDPIQLEVWTEPAPRDGTEDSLGILPERADHAQQDRLE